MELGRVVEQGTAEEIFVHPKEHLTMDQQIDYLKRKYSCDSQKLHCEEMELSSKEIRQKVREGISISDLVPREVEEYILSHHLYQEVSE